MRVKNGIGFLATVVLCWSAALRVADEPVVRAEILGDDTAPAEVLDAAAAEVLAPWTVAEVVEPEADPSALNPAGRPGAVITAEGRVFPGCWLLLDGSASSAPAGAGGDLRYEWRQSAGPTLELAAKPLAQLRLWLFLMRPGEYRIALRVGNGGAWSAPATVKFTVLPGRPYLAENEGRRVVGAGERVELPGAGWRQVE
jgi:hypothetical protein